MPDKPELTRRQQEALEWMGRVGKASERIVRRHGFATRTLDALVDHGLIDRDWVGLANPKYVYRQKRDDR